MKTIKYVVLLSIYLSTYLIGTAQVVSYSYSATGNRSAVTVQPSKLSIEYIPDQNGYNPIMVTVKCVDDAGIVRVNNGDAITFQVVSANNSIGTVAYPYSVTIPKGASSSGPMEVNYGASIPNSGNQLKALSLTQYIQDGYSNVFSLLGFAPIPTIQTELSASGITLNSADIDFSKKGNGSGRTIVVYKTFNNRTPLNGYYWDSQLLSKNIQLSTATLFDSPKDGFVVYQGNIAGGITISGLTKNTQYEVRAFEYNVLNNNYNTIRYNQSTIPNKNPIIFMTPLIKEVENGNSEEQNGLGISKIYPNPASSQLTLDFISSIEANSEISINDIKGNEIPFTRKAVAVKKGQNSFEISTVNLVSGTYLLSLKQDNRLYIQIFSVVR